MNANLDVCDVACVGQRMGFRACSHPDGTIDSVRRALGTVGVQTNGTFLGSALP